MTTCWVAGEQKQAHIGWAVLCQWEVMSRWATRNAALALWKAAGSFLLILSHLRRPPAASSLASLPGLWFSWPHARLSPCYRRAHFSAHQ